MDIQEARQLYRMANELINKLFRDAYFFQTELNATLMEKVNVEKRIVNNSYMLNDLFCVLLKLFEVEKIKNINMSNYTSEDIFNGNANTIIDNLCQSSFTNINFYKYNVYSFYIIACNLLKNMSMHNIFGGTSLWFFSDMYKDISSLLTMYAETVAKKKFNNLDISCGIKCHRSFLRQEINILLGIRHMLYGGTACDTPSTDLPNIAIFSLRNYIEFWLRENFTAYTVEKKFIPISKVFSVLKNNKEEINKDPIAKKLKGITRHIETLSNINTWSNTYIHSKYCSLFWIPHIVLKYLNFINERCRSAYENSSGRILLFPPFIPKQAPIYTKICNEIKELGNNEVANQ